MPKKSTRIPFESDRVYHIYNRGNNREKLFYHPGHYQMFLDLYQKFPGTLADTYCYCLIPNHFHFLMRIKENARPGEFVNQMRRWLISYAMSVNQDVNRRGHLFTRPVNRILVDDEFYFKHVVRYVHLNPVKHGICTTIDDFKYSSYRSFFSKNPNSLLSRADALEFFNGDLLEFIEFHRIKHDDEEIKRFILDDKG
jgi:putative transposase